mgnify:CR=1 FL=1
MTETTEKSIEYLAADNKKQKLLWRLGIGGVLGALSFAAYQAQHTGMTIDLPQPARGIAESMSHPAVGYLGALLTVSIADRLPKRPPKIASAIAGGTVANFSVEAAQSEVFKLMQNSNDTIVGFLGEGQRIETVKDYVFALGGVGIYMLSERPLHKKPTTEER